MITAGALAGFIVVGIAVSSAAAQSTAADIGITEDEAVAIALAEQPGTVTDAEFEREDGMIV